MSDRKRPDRSRLPKACRRYLVEAPTKGMKCPKCGEKMIVKAPSGSWVAFCPVCEFRIGH